jgi:exonuclease VII small subunit
LQFTDKITALVAELENAKAQLEAAEERDFQKGIAVMKLEEALAKSNADVVSSANMHAKDMAAATESYSRAQNQILALQEQLDAAAGRIEALSNELATAAEAQQMSAAQVSVQFFVRFVGCVTGNLGVCVVCQFEGSGRVAGV